MTESLSLSYFASVEHPYPHTAPVQQGNFWNQNRTYEVLLLCLPNIFSPYFLHHPQMQWESRAGQIIPSFHYESLLLSVFFTCGVVETLWLLRGDLEGRRCWGGSSSSRNKRLLFELRVGWKDKRGQEFMNSAYRFNVQN